MLKSEDVDLVIDNFRLHRTCIACPEQYDVYNENNEQIGYLRLRHGYFSAECPDVGGTLVHEAHTRGDGCFDEDERMPQLQEAVRAIKQHWMKLMEQHNVGPSCSNSCRTVSGADGNCCHRLAGNS